MGELGGEALGRLHAEDDAAVPVLRVPLQGTARALVGRQTDRQTDLGNLDGVLWLVGVEVEDDAPAVVPDHPLVRQVAPEQISSQRQVLVQSWQRSESRLLLRKAIWSPTYLSQERSSVEEGLWVPRVIGVIVSCSTLHRIKLS